MDKYLDVTAATPMGEYPARLRLIVDGEAVSGALLIMGHEHAFSGGLLKGRAISLDMSVKTPLGMIPLAARGTFDGENLDCAADTKIGRFRLRTERRAAGRKL